MTSVHSVSVCVCVCKDHTHASVMLRSEYVRDHVTDGKPQKQQEQGKGQRPSTSPLRP